MAEKQTTQVAVADFGPAGAALPMLAALFALLALWLGWSGVQQWRDARRDEGLQQARDSVLSASQQALAGQLKQLADRVAAAPVQTALRAGDSAAAARAIGEGWKGANSVQVLPADLEAAYAAPADFGFSKLALLEAALSENKPVARVVREGKQSQLGLAAPAGDWSRLSGMLPLTLLTGSFDQAAVPAQAYLAIQAGRLHRQRNRQPQPGRRSREPGPTDRRDRHARGRGHAGWHAKVRWAWARFPAWLMAALSGVLAVLTLLVARGRLNLDPGAKHASAADDNEPTLVQALQREPLPRAPARADPRQGCRRSDHQRQANKHVEVDPGIFRAYDIRGVVGETLSVEVAERIGQAIGTVLERAGADRHRGGPRRAPVRSRAFRRPDRGPAQGRPQRDRHRHGADAGRLFRRLSPAHRQQRRRHRQPQSAGLQRLQDRGWRADAVRRRHHRTVRAHQREPPAPGRAPGTLQQRDVGADYVQRIAGDVQMERPLKVVVDAGNGVAGDIAPRLLDAIGAEVIPLYLRSGRHLPQPPSRPQRTAQPGRPDPDA